MLPFFEANVEGATLFRSLANLNIHSNCTWTTLIVDGRGRMIIPCGSKRRTYIFLCNIYHVNERKQSEAYVLNVNCIITAIDHSGGCNGHLTKNVTPNVSDSK